MRSFRATNTNDIEEDADRGCRACKVICCLKKKFLLLCCDLDFLSSPCEAEVSRHKLGLPRRIKQSSSALSYAAVVTLSVSGPCDFSPCNPSVMPLLPPQMPWLKPTKIFLVPSHKRWPLRCLLGALRERVVWFMGCF